MDGCIAVLSGGGEQYRTRSQNTQTPSHRLLGHGVFLMPGPGPGPRDPMPGWCGSVSITKSLPPEPPMAILDKDIRLGKYRRCADEKDSHYSTVSLDLGVRVPKARSRFLGKTPDWHYPGL